MNSVCTLGERLPRGHQNHMSPAQPCRSLPGVRGGDDNETTIPATLVTSSGLTGKNKQTWSRNSSSMVDQGILNRVINCQAELPRPASHVISAGSRHTRADTQGWVWVHTLGSQCLEEGLSSRPAGQLSAVDPVRGGKERRTGGRSHHENHAASAHCQGQAEAQEEPGTPMVRRQGVSRMTKRLLPRMRPL